MTLKFPRWHSLKTRVTLFTLAIFLAGIWSLSFYASRMLHEDLQTLLGEQQVATLSLVAAEISQELEDRFRALESVAGGLAPLTPGNTATLQAFLEARLVLPNLFNGGYTVLDADGTAIADVPLSAGRIGVNYMDKAHVLDALRRGKAGISAPIMGRKMSAPIFAMAVPIRNAQGKVIGALTGATDLGRPNFLDKITASHFGRTGRYLLVAPQNRLVVTGTDKSRIMQPLPAPGINPQLDRFVQGYEGSDIFVNPLGEQVLASAKGIPVAGWYVAVGLPAEEAFAPVHAMQQRLLRVTILLTLLAGGLTWWMLRRQLAPMLAAAKALAKLSESNQPPQALPISSQDEIGELIGGFNRLLASLWERQEALRESNYRSRAIIEASPVPMALNDEHGNITFLNRAFVRVVGYTLNDIPTLADWWHRSCPDPQYRQRVADNWQKNLEQENRSGEPFAPMEVNIRCKDDSARIFMVSATDLEEKFPGRHLVILYDFTERMRSEADLRDSEEKFRAIANYTVDWETWFGPDGNMLWVNPAVERVTGYSPAEVLATPDFVSTLAVADDRIMLGAGFPKGMTGGGESALEFRYTKKNGSQRWLSMAWQPIFDAHGTSLGIRASGRDITERKQAEEALRASLAEKEVLMREIHHRVKNNLQMMSALLELQSGYVQDERVQDYFTDSQQRIQSMAMIHAQLYRNQDLARIDFAAYLRDLVDNLRGQYSGREVDIRIDAQACTLPVDTAVPLGLVLNELVSNAMKHAFPQGRAGELRIGLQCGDHDEVVVEVADNGVGLPAEPDPQGRKGFGTRIIKLMVEEQLHGKLRIESDHGTRVVCEIGSQG